jgi:hypothetical protein
MRAVTRHPADVLDPATGRVRVLSRRCQTCIFRPGNLMHLTPGRFEQVVRANVDAGALLTCHATLPYGNHPDFGPAVCAGFWARHGMKTAAGRLATFVLGVTRIAAPGAAEELSEGED